MARIEVVRDWLKGLGTLTAAAMSVEEAVAKLNAFGPFLAEDFADAAFTAASLKAVARQCRYFPTYGELAPLLQAWWDESRPAVVRDPQGPTEEDEAVLRNWQRHSSGDWGKTVPKDPAKALRHELELYRQVRSALFAHLVATDERARFIAERAGLVPRQRAAAADMPRPPRAP